jgi:oligopeptide transport system substrate-binding protein
MKKRYGVLALSATILGATLVGSPTTHAASKAKQAINIQVSSELPTIDSALASDTPSMSVINNFQEGLYRRDKNGKLQPAGASAQPTISDDGLTYTIKLRQAAKWSNGDKVTAKDYVFAWQRTADPATASEYAYRMEYIKNGAAITKGTMDKSALGIKAIGDYELEITLAEATPYFKDLLASTIFFPENQKYVEAQGDKYGVDSDHLLYNGPFALSKFSGAGTDTEWSLVKNKTYWDAKHVKLKTINQSVVKEGATALNLFNDGQLDDVTLTGELAQQQANSKNLIILKKSSTYYMEMNQAKADSPFKNANLRKAISYSINRKALANSVLGNGSVAATGMIPSGLAKNPETGEDFAKESGNHVSYSKKKAQAAWAKAKKELGISKLSFEILGDDVEASKKITTYLQGTIEETLPGVTVSVQSVPFSVRLDRSSAGSFDTVTGSWGGEYADPSNFADIFATGANYNNGKYSNAAYDKLVKAAGTTDATNASKRWTDLLKSQDILMKDMGVIPVYQPSESHLRNTKVKDLVFHSSGPAWDYKWGVVK